MQVFRQIRPIAFGKGYRFCQNSPLSKHELYGRLINTHYNKHLSLFNDGFGVLFSIFFPKSRFVFFSNEVKLLFFDQKRSKLSFFKKCTNSHKLRDFGNLTLSKNFCKNDFQNCFLLTSWWSSEKKKSNGNVSTSVRKFFRKIRFFSLSFVENVCYYLTPHQFCYVGFSCKLRLRE